jgi:hypothetical protein
MAGDDPTELPSFARNQEERQSRSTARAAHRMTIPDSLAASATCGKWPAAKRAIGTSGPRILQLYRLPASRRFCAMEAAMRPIVTMAMRMVEIALISGVTPRRT